MMLPCDCGHDDDVHLWVLITVSIWHLHYIFLGTTGFTFTVLT